MSSSLENHMPENNENMEAVLTAGSYKPERADVLISHLKDGQLIAIGNTNFIAHIIEGNNIQLSQAGNESNARTMTRDELSHLLTQPNLETSKGFNLAPELSLLKNIRIAGVDTSSIESTQDAINMVDHLEVNGGVSVDGIEYIVTANEGDYLTLKNSAGKTTEIAKNKLVAALIATRRGISVEKETEEDPSAEKMALPEHKVAGSPENKEEIHAMRKKLRESFPKGWETKMSTPRKRQLFDTLFPEYAANIPNNKLDLAITKLLKKFGVRKDGVDEKEAPEKKDATENELEKLSVKELREKLLTVTTSIEAREIVELLKGKNAAPQAGFPELTRLKQLVSAERDYLNKPVSFNIHKKDATGKDTLVEIKGIVTDIAATKKGLLLVVKTDKGVQSVPMEYIKLRNENIDKNQANHIIDKYLAYDSKQPFATVPGAKEDEDELEAYKLLGKAFIIYKLDERKGLDRDVKVKDGVYGKNNEILEVEGVYIRNRNKRMGYIVTDEGGAKRTVTHDELVSDLQGRRAVLSEKKPTETPEKKEEEKKKKPEDNIPPTEIPPNNSPEIVVTIENLRKNNLGKFIREKTNKNVLFEIVDVTGTPGNATFVVIDEKGVRRNVSETVIDNGGPYESIDRDDRMDEVKNAFLLNMKGDLDNMGTLKKTWLGIKKALWGQKMETGLSDKTKGSLDIMNQYLDRLMASADRRWKLKGYSPEKIKELKDRYRAQFMSGIQLETEYDELAKKKAEGTDTMLSRAYGWTKEQIKKIPPGVKIALISGAVIGVTAATGGLAAAAIGAGTFAGGLALSAIVSKKARELGKGAAAWAGFGITQGVRGLSSVASGREFLLGGAAPIALGAAITRLALETISATKGDPEKMKELRTKIEEGNNEIIHLQGVLKNATNMTPNDRALYEDHIKALSTAIAGAAENFKHEQGKYDKRVKELQEQYNKGAITPSEYLKKMQQYKIHDEIMETLKKSMTIISLGAAAYSIANHAGGGDGGEDTKPEETPVVEPTPHDSDAIVRQGEGITHVFKRQLDDDAGLVKIYEEKIGMDYESNKGAFLAKLAKDFGYIDAAGNDVRVAAPDVTAYELNHNGTTTEFQAGKFQETHNLGTAFEKSVDKHEYGWDGSKQYVGGAEHTSAGTEPEATKLTSAEPETTATGSEPETTRVYETTGAEHTSTSTEPDATKVDEAGKSLEEKTTTAGKEPETTKTVETKTGTIPGKEDPKTLLESNLDNSDKVANIVSKFDKFDETLKARDYDKLMDAEANRLLGIGDLKSDLSANELKLQSIMLDIKGSAGILPNDGETSQEFIDRGLEKLGSNVTVEKIHAEEVFSSLKLKGEEFIGETPEQTYKGYMNYFFDKSGGKWMLEGTDINYKTDIGNLPAEQTFNEMAKGEISAKTLQESLGISNLAATKLYDFFIETQTKAATTLDTGYLNGTTIEDVVRKLSEKLTNK